MKVDTITLARRVEKCLGGINLIDRLNSAQQRLIHENIVHAKLLLLIIIRNENDKTKKEKIKDIYNSLESLKEEKNKIEKQSKLNEAYSDLIDLFT